MQTKNLDVYHGEFSTVANALRDIFYFCPELKKQPVDVERLKGVLQLSKVEAIGFSYWEDNWHRVDLVISKTSTFKMPQLDLSLAIDLYEVDLEQPPESSIWVFTEHQTPITGTKRGLCFFTVYK
jgi:hypothetical protein